MISRDELKRSVVEMLNKEYGNKLLDLDSCIEIKRLYENDISRIKAELNLNNVESGITQTVVHTNHKIDEIRVITEQTTKIVENVIAHLKTNDQVKTKLEGYFKQLNLLECTLQYMKVVQSMECLSEELQKEIDARDDEQCATIFANLSEVARQMSDSSAVHLRGYMKEIVMYWHNILKHKFTGDFEATLRTMKWPFVNINVSFELPSEASIQNLQIIVEYLLQIDLPEELMVPTQMTGYLADFQHLSLPMQLLVEPLKKRFMFHFYGNRRTNRVDKPEWYFTKILSWIRDHTEFVEKSIQPVVDKMGLYHIDAKIELMRGLVQLAVEKLYADLPALQYDDFIFSHCVDEALGFDKELKESYDYPISQPGVLNVLTQAQVFIKWMAMEKKYALEKMDVILSDSFAEAFQLLTADTEDLKITACAEIFVTLLQTITERYEALPQPGHRLQFLELQLELLDDFRVRLLQLVHAEESDADDSRIAVIANTVFYIENVLVDWGSMLHFLNLFYYKSQLENPKLKNSETDIDDSPTSDIDSDTVFAEILSLYSHMKKDLLYTLAESIVVKAKNNSKNYRHEMWSKLEVTKDIRSLSLSPSACSIFQVLATELHKLQKNLTGQLFLIAWRSIARQIDTFLFEEVVLENRFNEGGALQFKYDMVRNLLPLFSQYTDKPESYFIQIKESCMLLNLTKGSALLLRETILALEGATGLEDRRGQALKEVGVLFLSPQMAVTVLNRRTDITINRISSID